MKTREARSFFLLSILALFLFAPRFVAWAGPQVTAGPYHVELNAEPAVLPTTGRAKLLLKVTDSSGAPVDGATIQALTKMPAMNMGEREETAVPVPGQPGVYTAPAQFAMEGGYEATLKVDGPKGRVTAVIPINTGQNTATTGGAATSGPAFSPASFWPWVLGILVVVFVLIQMRRSGQEISLRGVANRSVLGGLLLLGLILWGAIYAVGHFRRPGAWTPIDAQGMEMNLPAPVGVAPVELATVTRGSMESTVRYTGQAVGYVEQEVTPRITGVITWMPFYTGDRVKRGQLLARLDTSQAAPQVAAQQGQLAMARQGVGVSEKDYQQALAMIGEAHAELGMKTGALEAARADVSAAEQERNSAQANLEAAQTMTADATAQIQAAQADAQYWQDEMTREQSLLKAGAVTREEFQREQAQAQNAEAKVREARAHAAQVEAQVRAAQSGIPKASAMIAAAQARLQQAQSDLHAHEAHVRSASAAADSARQKIAQAQTGVQAARGVLAGASATQGYSEIRSETDGVITQRMISPGVLVSPGQVILRVARISPIRLQANVTESDLQKLRVGSRVLVSNQDASTPPITTRLTSIAPSIDPTARTGVAEALVSNTAGHFVPGQYVTMEISTGQGTNTLRIPTRALRYHTAPSGNALSTASTPTVWVAEAVGGADNQYTVHEVTVQTGMSDARSTEILSGLQAGQTVVTNGQDYLKDSDTVSPAKVQDMQTASASGAGDAVAPGIHRAGNPATHSPGGAHTLYTCLMHPEIVRDHPGACPKCGMALVPKTAGGTR